jgi:hypothetical protein
LLIVRFGSPGLFGDFRNVCFWEASVGAKSRSTTHQSIASFPLGPSLAKQFRRL